jgi:multicomponent Na+:H+ antiporter subunit F
MDLFVKIITVWVMIIIIIPVYRMAKGPTVFDRILATGAIGTKTVLLILLFGFIFQRIDMFIDIALAYAVLNFIGSLVIAKYLKTDRAKE